MRSRTDVKKRKALQTLPNPEKLTGMRHCPRLVERPIRPEWLFLVLATLLSLVTVILYPPGAGFDEAAHVARVSQLASGQLVAQEVNPSEIEHWWYSGWAGSDDALYGGEVDRSLVETAFRGNHFFLMNPSFSCSFPPWETDGLSADLSYGQEFGLMAFSNTAICSPIVYLPQVVGLLFFAPFVSSPYALIVIMRLFQTAMLIGVLFFSIRAIPIGKWVLACVCALPVMIFTASDVSADVVCLCCCIGFLVVLLKFLLEPKQQQRKTWVLLVILIVLLGQTKLTYLPLMFLAMLIPIVRREYRSKSNLIALLCAICGSLALFVIWYELAVSGVNTGAMFSDEVYPDEQLSYIFDNPLVFGKVLMEKLLSEELFPFGGYGSLGIHGVPIYNPTWLCIIVLLISITLKDDREVEVVMPVRTMMGVSFALIVMYVLVLILIITALYLQFTPVGLGSVSGLQRRYYLPVLPYLLMAILLPVRQGFVISSARQLVLQRIGMVCVSGLLFAYAVVTLANFLSIVF